jgi:hypothetical protein
MLAGRGNADTGGNFTEDGWRIKYNHFNLILGFFALKPYLARRLLERAQTIRKPD